MKTVSYGGLGYQAYETPIGGSGVVLCPRTDGRTDDHCNIYVGR